MADEVLSEAEAQTVRDGVNYARIALNGWKDGQWERVPKGWHLAQWAEEVDRLAIGHEALRTERDAARGAIRDLLWIVHHGELRGAEGMAMIHGFGYSPQFLAETTRKRQAAERLVGWEPSDGR